MTKIEINIDDYVSEDEKKTLCIEYIKDALRGQKENHRERVLSNMAYNASYQLLDEALTEEDKKTIRTKIKKLIQKDSSYDIFRKKDAWGQEDSEAYLEVKKAVNQNKHLINGLVLEAIQKRDYEKELNENSNYIADVLIEALRRGLNHEKVDK